MLLQRIRLKGFLGHRGLSDANGGDGFVDIDLRSSPLWLIHGPNGGGKSSLWDAVTFALFKKHRASGTRNDKFAQLIHDAADDAIVELYFELREQQQAQRYRIRSKISKIKRKAKKASAGSKSAKTKDDAKTWNIVERCNEVEGCKEDDWESVPGTEGKADEWAERNIGMGYETFVCAVLLRQGEADAFIKAKPAQRKSRLLELLQLEFYEELGKKANEHLRDERGKRDTLKKYLDSLPQPTEENLETQRRLIGETESNLEYAAVTLDKKTHELGNARQAESLLEQIKSVLERQSADITLIEQAATIEANALLYRELKDVSRILGDLWEARRQLAKESKALAANTKKIAEMEESHRKLTESLKQSRFDEEKAERVLREASARLEQELEHQRTAKDQATKLEQIELLEKEIHEAEAELKPYQATLKQRDRIEQDYERHTELSKALSLLRILDNATRQLEDARQQLESARAELSRHEGKALSARGEEERLRQVAQGLSLECDGLHQELNSRATELTGVSYKLKARNKVSGEEECPTCGSTLDEDARARIEHEREDWAEEAAKLGSETERLNHLLEEKTQALERARSEHSTAAEATLASRLEVERARSDFEHAAVNVTRAEDVAEDARSRAGDWAEQLAQLPDLKENFDRLAGASEERSRLLEAQLVETRVQSAVETQSKQLERLPRWSVEERSKVRIAAEECEQAVSACTHKKASGAAALEAARSVRRERDTAHSRLDGELRSERGQGDDLARREREAQARYESKLGELPPKWAGDPACVDEAALDDLNRKLTDLQDAEEEERGLRDAQQQQEKLKGSLEVLQTQLDEIPSEHRRDVAEVQYERDAADVGARRAGEELRGAKEELVKLEEQRRVADGRREEFIEVEKEFGYFQRLAEAFGPSGLRARVVQSAQETISSHANTILSGLSNGEWQVELQDVSETELEIRARNVMQTGAQPRPFEYLSGGEKFRVAVSLAVAIGQSVLGERVVDTLVIDEGFGSLDEINRDLMVKEMINLSEKTLRGGRVVVVSHLDDVRGDFGSRYRISKDSEGYIQAERNGQG